MAAFFTLGLQSQTTLETFFCVRRRVSPPPLFYSFDTPDTHPCLRSTLQLVHFKGVHLSQVHQLINTCTNRSLFGAAETAAPPDPGRCLQILVDTTCIFQPLTTSKPIGCTAAGRYGRCFHLLYFSADSHISKT